MEDFTYDFSNVIKWKWPLHENEYIDKLIKNYLFTHQFSEDIEISDLDILGIFKYFLDDDEMVFVDNNKYLFVVNNNNSIDETISFIKNIFKILSIEVNGFVTEKLCNNKTNMVISTKQYENTFNGKRIEKLYS